MTEDVMKKIILKKSLLFGEILFGLILALVIVVSIFPLIPPFKNYYHSRTVLTGSMEPKIPKGSVVINQWADQKNLKVGDVITYQHPSDKKIIYITHRIVKIDKTGLLWRFETKGDANPAPDFGVITQAGTEGKVILTIPLIGYLIEFFKTPVGFILLIALPLLIFIVQQIRDVLRLWSKRVIPQKEDVPIAKKKKSRKILAAMLIAFSFLAARAGFVTYASFTSGQATITGVTLSTAASFPGDVVINEVYYDPVQTGVDSDYEWFELYNNTSSPITLSGWTITDNNSSDTIPDLTLPANGFAVVAAKESGFKTNYSGLSGLIVYISSGKIGNGLADTGDRLVLKNKSGTEIDAVSWGDDGFAFGAGNGVKPLTDDGKSIARKTKGVDTNSPTDWHVLDTPNPGTNPHPPEEPATEPTPTPSPTPEVSPTPTPTVEPSPTPVPSFSPSSTSDPIPTPEPSPTAEPTPEPSTTPSPEPSPEPSPTVSPEPSPSPSPTQTPTLTPTPSPTSKLPTYGIA